MNFFKRQTLLAPQNGLTPKYFVSVQSQKGHTLKLADPRINRMALALMDMQAVLGGAASHWGGPCAFAEIVSALYGLVFHIAEQHSQAYFELFHLINDAGHCENGLYALRANYGLGGVSFSDLKGFRSLKSPLTGHGEAHLFPQGVYLSNGPLGSTLAQAQGLAMADKLSGSRRHTIVLMSDGACMEGEAKEAFSSIPGFYSKGQLNPLTVIVSDNNTKLSGRISKDSFSLTPFFKSLKSLGWHYVELPQAHNLKSTLNTLEGVIDSTSFLAKGAHKPIFVHAKTIKGYGNKATEEAEHGGHGFPLKNAHNIKAFLEEIYGSKDLPTEFLNWAGELIQQSEAQDKPLAPSALKSKVLQGSNPLVADPKTFDPMVKVQAGIGPALIYCKEQKNWPVISLSADLQGSTGVMPFRNKFPECSFDMGVSEANMISTAVGFAKQGFIPVVDTFAQFAVTKGALPLFMAQLSLAPVIGVFSHAGLQSAADGASHQCLNYLAHTCTLPRTDVYCLSSKAEAYALMIQAVESFATAYKEGRTPRSKIFFLGRENFPSSYLPEDYEYNLGRAQVVFSSLQTTPLEKSGAKNLSSPAITLWAEGPLLLQAWLAGKILTKKGVRVLVVNASSINLPDREVLISCLQKTNHRLLTIEDHHLPGGMGALVAQSLALSGVKADLQSLAVRSDFGRSAYKADHLYQKEKLMAQDIVAKALSF